MPIPNELTHLRWDDVYQMYMSLEPEIRNKVRERYTYERDNRSLSSTDILLEAMTYYGVELYPSNKPLSSAEYDEVMAAQQAMEKAHGA